ISPKEVPLKIDDDGFGGAVCDILVADGYRAVRVGAGTKAARDDLYPNRRSELWFMTAEKARKGLVSLAGLPRSILAKLKVQAMAPTWKADAAGRRVVERKDETKEKLGRSPDGLDAMNLAYYDAAAPQAVVVNDRPADDRSYTRRPNIAARWAGPPQHEDE